MLDDFNRIMYEHLCNNRMRPEEVMCSRRDFLSRCGMGMGALGLASLLTEEVLAETLGYAGGTHFPAKAKRVIHIFAQGAPSHVDTWDPKPELAKFEGSSIPGLNGVAMSSPFKFSKHGESGIEVSEVFPALSEHVDELAIIRSMYTDIPAHDIATVFMNTGSLRMARPSMGAWVLYGLGSANENMPGFISLRPGGSFPGGALNWGSAFMPGNFQATSINTQVTTLDAMMQNIRNQYFTGKEQRRELDLVQKLNELHSRTLQRDPQLEARIETFEMAYRMQAEATDAFDLTKESQQTRDLYGSSAQGRQLLIARRLV